MIELKFSEAEKAKSKMLSDSIRFQSIHMPALDKSDSIEAKMFTFAFNDGFDQALRWLREQKLIQWYEPKK